MTSERCDQCGVLPGRDHHYDCQSSEAQRIRREWASEAARLKAEAKQHLVVRYGPKAPPIAEQLELDATDENVESAQNRAQRHRSRGRARPSAPG